MLPEPYRLHHRSDFSRTVRRGERIGRRDLVIHALVHRYDGRVGANARRGRPADRSEATREPMRIDPLVRVGGPRFGLIVSKAVGSAVVRHRVARRLRHVCAQVRPELLPDTDIVIRALPGAADAGLDELLRQLRTALRKLGVSRAEAEPGGTPR